MAHGGPRAGAGRKPGSATKRTREIADAAAADGLTPLDYMLSLLRDEELPTDARFEAAKAAAPYIHPRLSAIETKAEVTISDVSADPAPTEAEWQAKHARG